MSIRQLKLPVREVRFTDPMGNDRRQIWVRSPEGYGDSSIPVKFDQGTQDLIFGPIDGFTAGVCQTRSFFLDRFMD